MSIYSWVRGERGGGGSIQSPSPYGKAYKTQDQGNALT